MSDTDQVQEQPKLEIDVTAEVAFSLKLQEFDKAIAISDAKTAELKMQKAAYVYDTNLQNVIAQAKAAQAPVNPPQTPAPATDPTAAPVA